MRCAARSRKLSHSLHAGSVASGKVDVATTSSGVCRRHARGSVASRNASVGWGVPHRRQPPDVTTTSSGVCRRHARGSVASRNADVGWGLPHRWPSALRIAIHRMRLSVNGYNAAAWAAFFLQPRNHIILWIFTQTLWICRHRRVNIPENRMILDRARRRACCFAAPWRQLFFLRHLFEFTIKTSIPYWTFPHPPRHNAPRQNVNFAVIFR